MRKIKRIVSNRASQCVVLFTSKGINPEIKKQNMNNKNILKASKTDALTKFVLRNPKTGLFFTKGFGFNGTIDNAVRLNGGDDLIRTWIVIKAMWCSHSADNGASIEAIQVGN